MRVLTVNGERREFTEDSFPGTGGALLTFLGVSADRVVAEVDGVIIPREEFSGYALRDGQSLELVSFVGGG